MIDTTNAYEKVDKKRLAQLYKKKASQKLTPEEEDELAELLFLSGSIDEQTYSDYSKPASKNSAWSTILAIAGFIVLMWLMDSGDNPKGGKKK